ncbi:MAG: SEL1-like repeat protein [Ruminococcus sp.]|nr:SEL1-like repeat protein [Ruminococcus sp.]MBP3580839.1 SEL1-like repeat protein [Clostridia bacterium]
MDINSINTVNPTEEELDTWNKEGMKYYQGDGVEQNYEEAVKWFRMAARKGFTKAMYNIGICYNYGEGVPENKEEAAIWYNKAAEKNYVPAQIGIAKLYLLGNGVPQDYKKHLYWLKRAAEQGSADAQYMLGGAYARGLGVDKNYKEAFKWLEKGAEQGDEKSQLTIGAMVLSAGKDDDLSEYIPLAKKWYRVAAENGNLEAHFMLSSIYNHEGNFAEGDNLIRIAAEKGHAQSQELLGIAYYTGDRVEQDYTKAAFWLHKAAYQGMAYAMYVLGLCYLYGDGVEENTETALDWIDKAAENGDQNAIDFLKSLDEE